MLNKPDNSAYESLELFGNIEITEEALTRFLKLTRHKLKRRAGSEALRTVGMNKEPELREWLGSTRRSSDNNE